MLLGITSLNIKSLTLTASCALAPIDLGQEPKYVLYAPFEAAKDQPRNLLLRTSSRVWFSKSNCRGLERMELLGTCGIQACPFSFTALVLLLTLCGDYPRS